MIQRFLAILVFSTIALAGSVAFSEQKTSQVVTSDESARCLNCHNSRQKKLIESWEKSKHSRNRVGCYECHRADPADPAAKKGHFGFTVQLPVSPKRCASCHPTQYASFASSTHAIAYETIRNAELASISPAIFESTCASCHGNELKMVNGKPASHKWPNHGIGRVNTDGSTGSCVACHGHHEYSLEVARSPETCGRCHRGPTGPAYEAWKASKHGSNWDLTSAKIDFKKKKIIPSEEPISHPDCFVCHMASSNAKASSTHNPGERLSWNLARLKSTHRENWGKKRQEMQTVCRSCHGNSQVDLFYRRFDATVMDVNRMAEKAVSSNASDSTIYNKVKADAIGARTGAAMLSPMHLRDAVDSILNPAK